MRMRLFGSRDGKRFFEMRPGIRNDGRIRFYGSSDNGETFFPIRFEDNYTVMVVTGNATLGERIDSAV